MMNNAKKHGTAIICIAVWFILGAAGCSEERRDALRLSRGWEFAVGSMDDSIGDAGEYRYRPVESLRELQPLLPGGRGILWLRNRFHLPDRYRGRHCSLLMGNIVNADETYVNGEFVGGYGRVPGKGKSYVNEWNRFRKYDVPGALFTAGENVLHVRLYAHYEGEIQGTPEIALRDDAVRIAARKNFSQQYMHLVLFFLMLFGALYSFSIFTRRREAKEHLYYGAACFFFALFESSFFITLVPGFYDCNIPFLLYRKIAFVPVPLVIFSLILLVNSFLRVRLSRWAMIAVASLCVGASLVILLLPDMECTVVLEKYMISLPVVCLVAYLLLVIVPGAKRRSYNAMVLSAGFLPFVICVAYDVVYHVLLGNMEGLYLSGIGFAVFVLSITFMLTTDFVRYQNTVESLNRDLLSEKERLQVTLASIGDGVVATDPLGTVLLANRQATDLLGGFGALEAGVSFTELMDRVDPHHDFRVLFDEISRSPKRMDFMCQSSAGGGERMTMAGSIAPLMVRRGAGGAVIVIRDISQDMKLQKEIMKMKNLESLGVLAGGIAHDFNNILMAIVGNINLAKYLVPEGNDAKEMLQEAERASLRARGLTQQLLTFAKGGAPVKQVASVEEVIRESALFVLRGSSIKVFFNFAGDLESVDIDVGQFSQVIQNMVINAQHAMTEHGIITISGENVEIVETGEVPAKPGPYVKIIISDNGRGIPASIIGRVFEPFFSTKSGGSGLGLASAHSVIRKHDGHITVRSQEGAGTEFAIFLPACGREGRRAAEPARSLALARGRVLIMDDEHDVLLIADRIFRLHGMEPTLVASGDAAVRGYREAMESGNPFRLAVLDLTMPGGGGGLEVLGRLRELDGGVTAVISSGYANDPIMSEYGRHGFRAVMVKPYRVEDVSDLIRRLRLDL